MATTAVRRTPITLRSVVPVIPRELEERMHLEKDLTSNGCIGFISKPWSVKDKKMVRKILKGVPNQYNVTVRG